MGKTSVVEVEKDGWIVRGASVDDLLIGIQAIQKMLATVSTAHSNGDQQKKRGRPSGSGSKTETAQKRQLFESYRIAVQFLQAIYDDPGLDADSLAAALKLGSRKATGARAVATRRMVERIGFAPDDAYVTTGKTGSKRWLAGPKIGEIVKKLEKQIETD